MISVIIPTYNHGSSVAQTVEYVLASKNVEVEVIVVNDGSEDDTREVLAPYENRDRVTVVHQENRGRNPARNTGFDYSHGEYIMFLDADAELDLECLTKLESALEHSDSAFAYSDFRYGFKLFKTGQFDLERLRKMNYIHIAALIRRSDFPGFDETTMRFQDWDLWLTIAEAGKRGVYVPGELMRFSTEVVGISTWMPKSWYKAPWKWLPWINSRVRKYEESKRVIVEKHNL